MVDLIKNQKETEFEKQTYSFLDVDAVNDKEFYVCQRCKNAVNKGYFCQIHNTLFCLDCMFPKDPKIVIKCREVNIHNPVFKNNEANSSITDCVFVPIKEIVMKK